MISEYTLQQREEKIPDRKEKEARLRQRALVIWLFGLSSSGKSTLAKGLERKLFEMGYATQHLDGDHLRRGVNNGLGFSDEARKENIRRAAEIAKLFVEAGVIIIASFITPQESVRRMLNEVIGENNLYRVYLNCPYDVCENRDPKGLYADARCGKLQEFTGKDSVFEEPGSECVELVIDTENRGVDECVEELLKNVEPLVRYEA